METRWNAASPSAKVAFSKWVETDFWGPSPMTREPGSVPRRTTRSFSAFSQRTFSVTPFALVPSVITAEMVNAFPAVEYLPPLAEYGEKPSVLSAQPFITPVA